LSAACLCAATTASKDIVATAAASPDLSTLVKAVTAAGLVDTLESPGPFTVFAPTDVAFAELPNGTLAHLLEPANIKELVSVLTYHVISGNIPSTDLKPSQDLATVEGSSLRIVKNSTAAPYQVNVYVNQAKVTTPDVVCTNGFVHIIDGVLAPPSGPAPSPAPSPAPGPAPGANHLFFKYVNKLQRRCGDVDAAPRVPAAIFDPANAAVLQAYEQATIEFYHVGGAQLQLGTCNASGYSKPAGTAAGTPWTSYGLMATSCDLKCNCQYPSCPDVPDEPAAGLWCSLCGPKYNAPITINLYTQ
jgi:uncharacterized surface protein with fasciclin (FAS1) repeats